MYFPRFGDLYEIYDPSQCKIYSLELPKLTGSRICYTNGGFANWWICPSLLQVRNQWANQLLSLISSLQALPEPAIGISPTLTHPLLLSLSPDFDSLRENDIALQLPELRKLLQMLRENRHTECDIGSCGPDNVFLVGVQ
ncbi:hypothetical protein ACFX2I_009848 [Malus domestica]